MKKFLTLVSLICAFLSLEAQSDLKQYWDSTFRNLTQTGHLNTGYFWDLGAPDPQNSYFVGQLNDSSGSYRQWAYLYQNFQDAALDPGTNPPPLKDIQNRFEDFFKQGIIAVPILYAEGGRIKKEAYMEGEVYFDSMSGTWENRKGVLAFEKHRIFSAVTYQSVLYQPEVSLLFGDQFFFGNSGAQIMKIQVQLRNEPYVQVQKELPQNFLLLYGENLVKFRILFSNGETLESNILLHVELKDVTGGIRDKHSVASPFNIGDHQGFIYTQPQRSTEKDKPLGAYVDYRPGYSNGVQNTCILKPLIIVEGIDFGYENFETGYYGGKCGSLGLFDLENGYITHPHESKLKNRIEYWDPIKKGPELINELRKRGYDIFYLDFDNGAEYMENNALLLVKCIELINLKKCSTEEIVVIGASMGGIISRYALNYMEKNKMPHCVRTYLSFDAPHQGANIPLGFQHFLKYMRKLLPGVRETFNRKIDRAATRQLLEWHCLSEFNTNMHQDRKDFLWKLEQTGTYPKLCRNIAISNGSINHSYQNFGLGDMLLNMNPYSARIDGNPLNFSAYVYAMSRYYDDKKPLDLVVLLPLGQSYRERVEEFIFPDHVPGSLRYDLREARRIYGVFNIINVHSATCFIPSTSSLDIVGKYRNMNIKEQLNPNQANPTFYPFEAYTGVEYSNEEHMQLTDKNVSWAIDQIERNRNELSGSLSTVYNFGRTERRTLSSISVLKNGVLQVNGNFTNGFGNGPFDGLNVEGSTYELSTTDCNPSVVLDEGGSLVLGDNNGSNNNKAKLIIRKGATLLLRAGSVLRIHNGSVLQIEEGAQLIYSAGASIVLEGESAMLQIDGKLRLESNAVFSISKGNAKNSGFVKFRNAKGGYGSAGLEVAGQNAAIDLKGDDKSDLILQVEGELINANQPYKLKYIKLENCLVSYGNSSRIISNADIYLKNVAFDKLYWANTASSDAFVLHGSQRVKVENCEFKNLNFGIKFLGDKAENYLELSQSRFKNMVNGLYLKAAYLYASNSVFEKCTENGIYIHNPENDIKIQSINFLDNEIGFQILNQTGKEAYVFLESCDFNKNQLGSAFKTCHTTVSCCRFLNNKKGLFDDMGILNLSESQKTIGNLYQSIGGNSTFAYNREAGIELASTMMFLESGKNNFVQANGVQTCNFVMGEMAYTSLTHLNSGNFAYKAGGNFWSSMPSNDLSQGIYSHYTVKFARPGGSSTINYFSGSLEQNINKLCYNPQSCSPCDYVVPPSRFPQGEKSHSDSFRFVLSPFPVSELLQIELQAVPENETVEISLYNMEGKLVLSEVSRELKLSLLCGNLPEGVYLLQVRLESKSYSQKVIVQHQ